MKSKPVSEVMKELEKVGINVSRRTLVNYGNQKLAPKPIKIGKGRGVESEYPWDMAAEVAASYRLLSAPFDMTVADVKKARDLAIVVRERIADQHYTFGDHFTNLGHLAQDRRLMKLLKKNALTAFLSGRWIFFLLDSQEKLYKTDSRLKRDFDEPRNLWKNEEFHEIREQLTHRIHLRTITGDLVQLVDANPKDITKWIEITKEMERMLEEGKKYAEQDKRDREEMEEYRKNQTREEG